MFHRRNDTYKDDNANDGYSYFESGNLLHQIPCWQNLNYNIENFQEQSKFPWQKVPLPSAIAKISANYNIRNLAISPIDPRKTWVQRQR